MMLLLVSALGYFVDVFDLYLFSVLRVPSLQSLGVPQDRLMAQGMILLNLQMIGLLIGGFFWGILGDRRGRASVLFGSILCYSLSTLLNAWVQSFEQYAVLRLIAGFGLAGELGAAVTLVSESFTKEKRGFAAAWVAGVGLSGAVFAALCAHWLSWRMAYALGGMMGLALLVLRLKVHDSEVFERVRKTTAIRGDLRLLFRDPSRLLRYIALVVAGAPNWYIGGILISFAPEFGRALGVSGALSVADAVFYMYLGVAVGDVISGVMSQWLKTRLGVMTGFILATGVAMFVYLGSSGAQPQQVYGVCAVIGFCTGYWSVLMMSAAEQFGTNLRSTVATTIPNLIRSTVVPLTIFFEILRAHFGLLLSARILGALVILAAMAAVSILKETYSKDIDFVEI